MDTTTKYSKATCGYGEREVFGFSPPFVVTLFSPSFSRDYPPAISQEIKLTVPGRVG